MPLLDLCVCGLAGAMGNQPIKTLKQQQAVLLPGETEVVTLRQPDMPHHCSKSFCLTPASEFDLVACCQVRAKAFGDERVLEAAIDYILGHFDSCMASLKPPDGFGGEAEDGGGTLEEDPMTTLIPACWEDDESPAVDLLLALAKRCACIPLYLRHPMYAYVMCLQLHSELFFRRRVCFMLDSKPGTLSFAFRSIPWCTTTAWNTTSLSKEKEKQKEGRLQ